MFDTWTHAGLTYLAFPMGDGFGIVDREGGWYGAWQDVANFRKRVKAGEATTLRLCTSASLSVRVG